MSCSAPGLFRSHSDFFSKAGSTTQKMVQTAGGDVHFVEKKVSLGLIDEEPPVKSPGSDELEVTENNSRLQRKSSQKRKANRSKSEGNLALRRVADQVCLTQTLPVLGEPRHVYLDMKWARFGFRLQVRTYTNISACSICSSVMHPLYYHYYTLEFRLL